MIEKQCDLWAAYPDLNIGVRFITTNGYIKKNGRAVMGRGCAKEAKEMFPNIDLTLAHQIKTFGNIPSPIEMLGDSHIFSFPVKHNWWEKADINLIKSSAEYFVEVFESGYSEKYSFLQKMQ